jgi:replicative DNA helicase
MLEGSIEENVLALLCHSVQHSSRVAMEIKPELFSTRAYRSIATHALDYLNEFNRPPKAHLVDLLEAEISRGAEGELIYGTVQAMERLFPSMNEDYIVSQLETFMRKARMTQVSTKFAELVHRNKLDEAQEVLIELDLASPPSGGIWAHEPDDMLAFLDKPDEDIFSSGVEELDKRGCRPARKTMMVLIAPPKRGKSWFLVGIGKNALMRNQKVLHITLENSEELTARRYVQALFAMAKDDVGTVRLPRFNREVLQTLSNGRDIVGRVEDVDLTDTFIPEIINDKTRAKIARKLEGLKTRGRLHIKEWPTNELTIGAYRQYLDYLERRYQFIPDIVLMDYADLMAISGTEYRIALGQIFKSLRGIAVKRNHAFVTVTQGNRGSATAKVVGLGMVGEDFSKVQTADTILTYNQTRYEKEAGLARLLVAAARDTEDQYFVSITQAYKVGQFCLDSAYLTNDLRQITERAMGVEDEDDTNDD